MITKAMIFDSISSEESGLDNNPELYYAKIAYEHLGLAIRDNSVSEIIYIGKAIDNGEYDLE